MAKFGAVGGAGVLVNLGVFNLVRNTSDLPVVRASIIATVVAIVFNYVGFRYWTYRDRDKGGRTRELVLFLLFSAAGLVIENGLLYLATYGFGWDTPLQSNVFKFVGIGVATLFRFWSYRTWVFRALPAGQAVAGAESILKQEPRRPAPRQRVP
jgi:putative flippase GtrA